MDFRIFRNSFSITYFLMVLVIVDVIFCHQPAYNSETDSFYEATRNYELGNYETALLHYEAAIAEDSTFISRYPQIQFKIAYCLQQSGQHVRAYSMFQAEKNRLTLIEDYADFFALKSLLALGDTASVVSELQRFRSTYPQTTLDGPIDSLLADLSFRRANWQDARIYYTRLLNDPRFDKGDIYGKLIRINQQLKAPAAVSDYALNLITKFPYHVEATYAFQVYANQYIQSAMPQAAFRPVINYLFKTEQFAVAEALLDRQEKFGGNTELMRWLRIKKEYEQKNYWVAFQACNEQRSSFKNGWYLREIDLHIARCYLRLGSTDKAIQAYDTFQRRYPQDRLAAEVLWVIAWMHEGRGNIPEAQDYYQRLIVNYPQSEFIEESHFRIGLASYRLGNYSEARTQWNQSLKRPLDSMDRDRYQYWLAKAYQKEENDSSYVAELLELAKMPFENYYSMKAFLLTAGRNQVDTYVDSLLWELHHKRTSYLPQYLDQFQRPLIVQDILGARFAQAELNSLSKSLNKSKWELLFALGELNERLENYGKAYNSYRRIFNENFANRDWKDWIFLLKQLYPFYFDGEVNKYAQQWKITPASIWAIMKKESAFEPQVMSYANAYGLMQIIPPTAHRLSQELGMQIEDVRQLYEPNFNIKLGSYYISELLKRYDGNLFHALAAYNAGEHRVDRWRKVLDTDDDDFFMENIEFEQTRGYVRGAMKFYWTYYLMLYPDRSPEELLGYPERISLKDNTLDLQINKN